MFIFLNVVWNVVPNLYIFWIKLNYFIIFSPKCHPKLCNPQRLHFIDKMGNSISDRGPILCPHQCMLCWSGHQGHMAVPRAAFTSTLLKCKMMNGTSLVSKDIRTQPPQDHNYTSSVPLGTQPLSCHNKVIKLIVEMHF